MIRSSKHREAVEALKEETAALRGQVATLGEQLAALSSLVSLLAARQHEDFSGTSERLAASQAQAKALEGRGATLDEIVASHATAIAAQTDKIAALQEANERHEEEAQQLRASIARTERQAALDLDEMRQTSTALATSVLLRRSSSTSTYRSTAPASSPSSSSSRLPTA